MKHITKHIGIVLISLLVQQGAMAQQAVQRKALQYGAQYTGKRKDSAMAKFRTNRFGQFIHWGLYAIPGGIWEGKTYNYAAEFLKSSAKIPSATWDSLMYQFNPTQFDARAWAKMAKHMGVKYMTITTKHHEGFCLWPSQYTDFHVGNTPFKRDILKEVVDAYNAEGIDVNFYYSVLDWHHPDWKYDIKNAADQTQFLRYLDFAYNQLKELATRYPTVKCFWFDGTWDNSIKKNGWWTWEVEKMLKQTIPGVIVNSRLRADDYGARHRDSNGELMGDYESGYERRLPDPVKDVQVSQIDWEACMTIPENQWGYHKDWGLSYVKTPQELLEMLTLTTSLGGNFLLNFGPQGNGAIRPEEKQIAATIGDWMKVNGEAIYGGDYAGWKKQDWGYYIRKSGTNKVYMVVYNQPFNGIARIQVPDKVKITKSYLLESPSQSLPLKETQKNQFNLYLPAVKKAGPYIIVLETASGEKEGASYQEAKT
jgi:alpha-L-fucosidase